MLSGRGGLLMDDKARARVYQLGVIGRLPMQVRNRGRARNSTMTNFVNCVFTAFLSGRENYLAVVDPWPHWVQPFKINRGILPSS